MKIKLIFKDDTIQEHNTVIGRIIIRPQDTDENKPADISFIELAIIEKEDDKNISQLVSRSVMIDIRNIKSIDFNE